MRSLKGKGMSPSRPHPQLSRGLKAAGGVLLFMAYALFAFFYDSITAQQFYMYGIYVGIVMVMMGIGLGADATYRDRYLLYFPIATFYIIITLSYLIDHVADEMVMTKWTIYPSIIMLLVCLTLYFKPCRSTSTR